MNFVIIIFKNGERLTLKEVYAINGNADSFVIAYKENGQSKYTYPAYDSIELIHIS